MPAVARPRSVGLLEKVLLVTALLGVVLAFVGPAGAGAAVRTAQRPRHALTPGAYAAGDTVAKVCAPAWPVTGPALSLRMRKAVFARYHLTWSARAKYTLDLLIPRGLGGTPGLTNLWPQPRTPAAGMRSQVLAKNRLEQVLRASVCEHRLSLASARHQLGVNWLAAYHRYVAGRKGVPPRRTPPPPPSSPPAIPPVSTVRVHDTAGLVSALRNAVPGTDIELADARYALAGAPITVATVCTAAHPCTLHGGRGAVLDGTGLTAAAHYALHLAGACYWTISGLRLTDGNKGVVLDAASHDTLTGLEVDHVGDEGIHLRDNSSYDTVASSYVHDTGLAQPGFGEGIYIGTAKSNWRRWSHGRPDASNADTITGNVIAATTAENVDIKEGTEGGVLSGNSLDASATSGENSADSWVDVKGNDWLIVGNHGVNATDNPHFRDGFQTHVQVAGDGEHNRFLSNRADMGSSAGYAIHISSAGSSGNVVACDNRVTGPHAALSNVTCTAV